MRLLLTFLLVVLQPAALTIRLKLTLTETH